MAENMFWRSHLLHEHGVTGFFTLRHGGVSQPPYDSLNFGIDTGDNPGNVNRNMGILLHTTGLAHEPHQAMQEHGIKSMTCRGQRHMHSQNADILLSSVTDCALAVRTADCLPILLADPQAGIIAAVHSGWRGTAQGVATAAVQAMCRQGAKAERILASLGPCIGPCCFTLDEKAAATLAACCPDARNHVSWQPAAHADLAGINMLQLGQAGIAADHIEHLQACTCCQPQDYYSYRRDGAASGRHLAVVATGRAP